MVPEKLTGPPIACHWEPSNRLTRICVRVPSSSCQVTYGTLPTLATLATLASRAVETFSESPTAVQLPASSRLTRIWKWLPSYSSQATYGTSPTLARDGE
jgi:hypothetical protein